MKKLTAYLLAALAACCLSGCGKGARTPPPAPALSETPAGTAPAQEPGNPAGFEDMRILFINVGKADSALVSYRGRHFLVDTGAESSLPALVRALRACGVEALEGIFLTHTHTDHIGGLEGVLRLFDVKNVYAAEITENKKKGGNAVDERAGAAGKTVRRLARGDEITLGPAAPGAKFAVLGPVEFNADDDNDNSLVLRLECGRFSCIFTGDMQFGEEESLLAAGAFGPCTVLKVGNHGNPDATSEALVSAVSPALAIISTDTSEDEDTPAQRVLDALEGAGARVLVTQDAQTGVLVQARGEKVSAEPFAAQAPPAAGGVAVESLDREAELLVLRNESGSAIGLTGWWILSERGGDMFFFPKGAKIEPGGTLSIGSGKNPPEEADLLWEDNNVWHDKKGDAAVVFDAWGNVVCRME